MIRFSLRSSISHLGSHLGYHLGQARYDSRRLFSLTPTKHFWKGDFGNVDQWARRKCIEWNRNDFLKLSFASPLLNKGACQKAINDAIFLGRSESLQLIFQQSPSSLIDELMIKEALIQTIIHLQPECLAVLLNSRTISEEILQEAFVNLFLYHEDEMEEIFKDIAQSAWKTCKAFYKASVPIMRVIVQGEDPNHSSNRVPLIDFGVAKQATEGKLILLKERMDRLNRVKVLLETSPHATPPMIAQAYIEASSRR